MAPIAVLGTLGRGRYHRIVAAHDIEGGTMIKVGKMNSQGKISLSHGRSNEMSGDEIKDHPGRQVLLIRSISQIRPALYTLTPRRVILGNVSRRGEINKWMMVDADGQG